MNTKNIKTVIIILLIIANVFLISNITVLNLRLQNIPLDMINNAADILKEHGIYADVKIIPVKKPVNYVYEGVFAEYGEIVKNFSGVLDEESVKWHTTPEYIAFDAGEYRFKFEDYQQIEIVKTDYAGGAFELFDGNDNLGSNETLMVESIIKNFLKKYSEQDIRTDFVITELKREDGSDKVIINQTADGFLIASYSAYVIINDGEVKYFSGRWYFGVFSGRYEMPLLDSVNILFKILEKDGSSLAGAKIENMGKEYNLNHYETDKFYLSPSWLVIFDDERKVSYNMITGNKND